MLLLAACSGSEPASSFEGAYIGGGEGIELSFEPFSVLEDGVYTIFDTEDFPIDVLIKNKGEHTVAAGDVSLTLLGPAQQDFENIPAWELVNVEEIEKISEFNPEGDEELISFTPDDYAVYLGEVIGFYDIPWTLDFEYLYATNVLIDNVCFKEDISDDRVCEVEEAKGFSVSGAPITVTSVEEDTAGQGIMMLRINIRNTGTGEATIPGEDFDDRFSQVAYTIDEPDLWECKSGGREDEARLVDGEAEVICKLREPLADGELYTKSVQLTLDYVYQDLITETLRIKESIE